jgi:AcrR family transcriptional regulator
MPDARSRRQRRATERRRDILVAAATVFRAKGYDRATTREIAAEADVSEGSIYTYFRSKKDLLTGIVEQVVPELMGEALVLGDTGDVSTRITDGFERMLTFVCEHRDMLSVLVGEVWRDDQIMHEWIEVAGQRLLERLEERFRTMVSLGMVRKLDPAMGARMVLFAGLGVALPLVRGVWALPEQAQRRQMAGNLADLLLNGMAERSAGRKG